MLANSRGMFSSSRGAPKSWMRWRAARRWGALSSAEGWIAIAVCGVLVPLDIFQVANKVPACTSQEHNEPFAPDDHNLGWGELSDAGLEAIERIASLLEGVESVRTTSPCLGEKMANVPLENPMTMRSSVEISLPDTLFRFLRFLLVVSSPAPALLSVGLVGNDAQCTADTREFWKTDSAIALPDSVSNTRRRCLSTANAIWAKNSPDSEKALKDAALEVSAMRGSESAVVLIGRLLLLTRCTFFEGVLLPAIDFGVSSSCARQKLPDINNNNVTSAHS